MKDCPPAARKAALGGLGAAFFPVVGVGAFTFALSSGGAASGLSASWIGLAFSGYFLARLVLAPLAGYLADSVGAMPLLLAASGAGTLVPLIHLFFPVNESLAVIQILLGFCAGIIKPVSMSVLGECVPQEKRGRLFGAYNTCLYAGMILAPLAGGLANSFQGGMGTLTLTLPCLGMGLTFLLFLPAARVHAPPVPGRQGAGSGPPWRNPAFLALLLAVLGRTTGSSVVVTFLPRLINERFGLSGIFAGLLFALPNMAIILGMPVTGKWADSRDRTGLTFLGMGVCAACLFGFGQPLSMLFFACLSVVMGLGSALSLPASMSLAADMGASRGSVMGVFLGAANLGFVLGPSLAGFAAQFGGMSDAFELAALFSGLCLLPTFAIMSKNLYADR